VNRRKSHAYREARRRRALRRALRFCLWVVYSDGTRSVPFWHVPGDPIDTAMIGALPLEANRV